jgi:hypothetical protein
MEKAKMPHYQAMDQENVVVIHNGILFSPQRRMKFCHSQVNGWNRRTGEVSQAQKAKNHVFPHMRIIDPKQMQ